MREKLGISFEDCAKEAVGKIFVDRWDDGLRFVILRGPAALCAYIGVPLNHPLAGHSYEDLPVQAHGGLTYADESTKDNSYLPVGMFWYGWDYAHCDDFAFYDLDRTYGEGRGKKWTPDDVDEDSWSAIWDFHHLVKLTEAVQRRALEVSRLSASGVENKGQG